MEVKITKEIQEYKESLFFGLNLRQCVCSLLALLVAVGLYFVMQPMVGTEEVGWMCILGAAPFAACGFIKYHGMTAERWLWAIIKSELLCPKRLVFKSENLYYACLADAIAAGERPPAPATRIKGKMNSHKSKLYRKILSTIYTGIDYIKKKMEEKNID